jgi:hypothetical protein
MGVLCSVMPSRHRGSVRCDVTRRDVSTRPCRICAARRQRSRAAALRRGRESSWRFPPSVASRRRPDARTFTLSHSDCAPVCLTNRSVPLTGSPNAGQVLATCREWCERCVPLREADGLSVETCSVNLLWSPHLAGTAGSASSRAATMPHRVSMATPDASSLSSPRFAASTPTSSGHRAATLATAATSPAMATRHSALAAKSSCADALDGDQAGNADQRPHDGPIIRICGHRSSRSAASSCPSPRRNR